MKWRVASYYEDLGYKTTTIMSNTFDLEVQNAENTDFKMLAGPISWDDIVNRLFLPLTYQYLFQKKTSPMETKEWNKEGLSFFTIITNEIDRVYHFSMENTVPSYRRWELACRMKHDGQHYFITMYANCLFNGPDADGYGFICFTKHPQFFLKHMVTMDLDHDKIYKALKDDRYDVEQPDSEYKSIKTKSTPLLTELCLTVIYKNKKILGNFKTTLPKILANSVDEFIKLKEWEKEYLLAILR